MRPSDQDIVSAYNMTGSQRQAARLLGVGRGMVDHTLRRLGISRPLVPQTPSVTISEGATVSEGANGAVKEVVTNDPVKTLEDAIRVAEVDTDVWFVDRWECSQWTVPMRVHQGQEKQTLKKRKGEIETLAWKEEKPLQTQQYRVKVYLKRLMPLSLKLALDAVFERLSEKAPRFPDPPHQKATKAEQHLALFGLFDAHFGKLGWAPEVGESYDLKIAEAVYRNAVEDLIAESAHRRIGLIVLPVGQDFFHMDNRDNSTLRGTRQDVDGRYAKVITAGELAVVSAIERLQEIAPVKVLWVPGNHDATTSYHLSRTLWAWFRKCKRVEVDAGPCSRKYVRYGVNLLGLTHGDDQDLRELPDIMANERPADWSEVTCREWLVGHWHVSRRFTSQDTEQRRGTVVRVLKSMAGTDAWHHSKGFVNAGRAAEVYFYGKTRGYVGHALALVRS